jgi:hypothetical protein
MLTAQYTATAVRAVTIDRIDRMGSHTALVVPLPTRLDYSAMTDAYLAMPPAVTFEGRTFGKTGWNSDTGRVYYRDDRPVAGY